MAKTPAMTTKTAKLGRRGATPPVAPVSDDTQRRSLLVRDGDGNVYRWTPAEWAARDPTAGWVSVDEQGTDLPDDADAE